ncbi:hypothetical protein [Chryseobacterium gambrini]|uniref:hypothetical protein n=1 Tax=Chryseobacterium gambrini TaxID=373672 RepID=UPI0022F3E1B3|nr:hypothetical protein [Chryseobacterium gambrini]WBX95744.1 hypothetical protein PE065_12770 [Chryseobacterium gambrini]
MVETFLKEMNDCYDKAEKALSQQPQNGLLSWLKENSNLYSKYAMFALTTVDSWDRFENKEALQKAHLETYKRHTEFMNKVSFHFSRSSESQNDEALR